MSEISVYLISRTTLEPWGPEVPWTTGQGGSEQAAIEMHLRLVKRGYKVKSFVPLPNYYICPPEFDATSWGDVRDLPTLQDLGPSIIINYRDASLFDQAKPVGQHWWFIAQDVSYNFVQPNLEKIDRYICLCKEHTKYTAALYPFIAQKNNDHIFTSSNGIRTDYLDEHYPVFSTKPEGVKRDPHRMLYASSPDRGLKLLLENWFRVRERFPDATLRIAYGFDNMQKIIALTNGNSWHGAYQSELEDLITQDGITWLGRLPVDKLYQEWSEASVWPYPNDFCETSCITSMDAQALGAIPVTNNLWAVGENVQHGYMVDGVPQKSELLKGLWLSNLYKALDNKGDVDWGPPDTASPREEMMSWARKRFDWSRIVDQWARWIEADQNG